MESRSEETLYLLSHFGNDFHFWTCAALTGFKTWFSLQKFLFAFHDVTMSDQIFPSCCRVQKWVNTVCGLSQSQRSAFITVTKAPAWVTGHQQPTPCDAGSRDSDCTIAGCRSASIISPHNLESLLWCSCLRHHKRTGWGGQIPPEFHYSIFWSGEGVASFLCLWTQSCLAIGRHQEHFASCCRGQMGKNSWVRIRSHGHVPQHPQPSDAQQPRSTSGSVSAGFCPWATEDVWKCSTSSWIYVSMSSIWEASEAGGRNMEMWEVILTFPQTH